MKKSYSKPDIIFESFSLSTSIAGDCGTKIDTQALNMCAMITGGLAIFLDNMSACKSPTDSTLMPYPVPEEDGQFNGICYHVPYPTSSLFNS